MSDKNKKTTTQQADQGQLSKYGLARAYAKSGLYQSTLKGNDIAQKTASSTPTNVGIAAAQMALAGGKNYAKAAYHAGMGFMEGVSQQNPNSGQQLNNMKINQSIAQGKPAETTTSKSTNKGIASFQNKMSGQTSSTSKNSTSGSSKGTSNAQGR